MATTAGHSLGRLIPISGCWVRRTNARDRIGRVLDRRPQNGSWYLNIDWGHDVKEWVKLDELEAGFEPGMAVQDVPISTTRRSMGPGRVIGYRTLGQRQQVLVQFFEDGRSLWLPYENLRRIKDVRLRYLRAETGVEHHAERFRLRLLAHALENWNQLTGSLDRLDVDPLPHQIQLVHRILSSGNYNWLIADDVGLGKTIEVGLLLAALKRKGQARRVLVVAPAGLIRQWQDEFRYKFDQIYEIYGLDFHISNPDHWKLHDHVIVSVDLAKREEHLSVFRGAGGWDVVVFDEGHKLTRHADGQRAQRYRLAEVLRPRADAFLLLSGTPHQGYADRFIALLELVRPDLRRQVQMLEANPEIVGELILRNRKSEVTDADGNFIFKGQQIHRVAIEPSETTRRFQTFLNDYLKRGYKAGEKPGATNRAIGFVMTTYRKLASSSIAAIERALELRRDRLLGHVALTVGAEPLELSLDDLSEGGDEQDDLASTISRSSVNEFFEYENDMIAELLEKAAVVRKYDEKLNVFLQDIVRPVLEEGKKLLIFTEYRATQGYIVDALQRQFSSAGTVVQINGSMKLEEKIAAIEAFNGPARFLVSTEAGGEGINLQQACHVMVNYDLPWNPARLVQRIGRLYRYGQQHPVIVFNLHAHDNFDNQAISLMLDRVMQIARDMAPVGSEYNDRLYADIVGDVLDSIDMSSILKSAHSMEIVRTRQEIEDAIERARRAHKLQQEIFSNVSGYDPNALKGTLGFTMQHVNVFIRGMLPFINASLVASLHDGKVLEIRLPENLRGHFPEFAERTVVRVTTDRRLAHKFKDTVLLDFETPFFRYLIDQAKSHEFDGYYASAVSPAGAKGVLAGFKLRWQNDQGEPLVEEFVPLFASADAGTVEANPAFLAEWLVASMKSAPLPNPQPDERRLVIERLVGEANRQLARESTRFKHPSMLIELGVADCSPQ